MKKCFFVVLRKLDFYEKMVPYCYPVLSKAYFSAEKDEVSLCTELFPVWTGSH
jgi:hypothetical protein